MIGNSIGVFVFTVLAVLRFDQAFHGSWMSALIALQSGLAVWLYFRRNKPEETVSKWVQALAWVSALLPIAFSPGTQGAGWPHLLPVPGLLIALWAMISLGKSFSIAPADRGLVQKGPYRIVRHPMYLGELLSLVGVLIVAWSLWNALIFTAFTVSVIWRILEEEALLDEYETYRFEVSWRLVWQVW